MKKILALGATLAISGTALAGAIYGPGPGGAIPDNSSTGIMTSIMVPDSFSITDVNVTVNGLTHSWVGDVIITVTHNATTATLVSRIGQTSGTSAGDSSNYGGDYTFDSDSTNNIQAEALLGTTGYVLRPGTYWTSGATQTVAQPNGSVNNNSLNVFDGMDASGEWKIMLSDHAGADLGNFGGWTVEIAPEPTSLSLLGLAGLALIRRR